MNRTIFVKGQPKTAVLYHSETEESKIENHSIIERIRALKVEDNPSYPLNDIGVSRLFYDLHSETICYVPEAREWYIYTGKRWSKDGKGLRVMELCKAFTQSLHEYAKILSGDKEFFEKYVAGLHGRKRRESIIRDACSINPRSLSLFDLGRRLFNCGNGTFNLETMTLQPHSPDDYITKISNADYNPDVRCGRWDSFVSEVMSGDAETSQFLQKSFGYCLSGETPLECFFILYGSTTRNGKTTACETVAHVLGEYARNAQPETLAKRSRNGSSPSPDIARLKGARFVNMPEPERGLELNVALVKQLTGGDTYTGRYLHENPVEFIPEFKIFINTNHLPRTNDNTMFSSGRVKLIPFDRHFSPDEQDAGLKQLFRWKDSISGILNWLIDGYRLLQAEGLNIPEKILRATMAYRQEADETGTFLRETLTESEGTRIQTASLYRRYVKWAKDNGYNSLNNKNFIAELRERYTVRRDGDRGNEVVGMDYLPPFPLRK